MKYRRLGDTGMRFSEIGLGSYLTIGMSIDESEAEKTVRRAFDLGINFFDTANVYNNGMAEETLGKLLRDFPRHSFCLASKAFGPMGEGPNDRGLSAKHLNEQCEASLKRLGVDYLDLYQCHRPDGNTPIGETVRTMDDLARSGKILYWGVSEWPAWLIERARSVAIQIGARPPVSDQPRYSLMYRKPEAELFQYCREAGIGNVVFSPLAHGVLTGKYEPGKEPAKGTRAADPKQNAVLKNLYWSDELLEKAQELAAIAGEMGVKPAQLALAWVLRREELTSTIIGASKVAQVEENAAAVDVEIPDDVLEKIESLFPGPGETYPIQYRAGKPRLRSRNRIGSIDINLSFRQAEQPRRVPAEEKPPFRRV